MAQRRPFNQSRGKRPGGRRDPMPVEPPKPLPRSIPKTYGPMFVLMENDRKQTFQYQAGSWVEYGRTIAECRMDCDVKVLSQKVNNMTRYEIRPELAS